MASILNGFTGNGTTNGGTTSAVDREPSDAQMDQIRDLLFGSVRDEMIARFDALERRVANLEQGLAAARRAGGDERRAAFDSLAKGITDLGAQVRNLAKP